MFHIVEVSGRDAADFLQGQLTQDIRLLGDAGSLPTAWCNPRGRVIATLRLLSVGERLALALPADLVEDVVTRLQRYRLRADVSFAADGEWTLFAACAPGDLEALADAGLLPESRQGAVRRAGDVLAVDTGASPRCVEIYAPPGAAVPEGLARAGESRAGSWEQALVRAGVPTVTSATSEAFTPHMLNLDVLGAVSFTKGCYPGQEIVARTRYRGKSRRRLLRFRAESPDAAVNDPLYDGERECGRVVNAVEGELLAVVPLELRDRTLILRGAPVTAAALPYELSD